MGYAASDSVTLAAWTEAELADLNLIFRHRPTEDLLDWATTEFGNEVVLTCSFGGAAGMVLLDMVARLGRGTPVVFLDTDLLFAETYALLEEVQRRYDVKIEHRHPALTLAEQERREGPQLFARDPDRCCHIRKVLPLAKALEPYAAWINGVRREQSQQRSTTELLQWSAKYNLLKLCPLAYWTEREVWNYIAAHNVPYNPLLNQGYPSLGCVPCTHPANGSDSRAGRWVGFAKTECGIHL